MKELLRDSTLFGKCTPAQIDAVAERCTRRSHAAGEVIFDANAPAEHLYVVESGLIELHFPLDCHGATQQFTVDRKLRGDVLGWSSLLESRSYSLSATAMRETVLLRIRSADLDDLFADDHFGHVVMRRLAETIAQRFNVMQQLIVDLVQDRILP